MIEIKHAAVFLFRPFAGAGERVVWKQIRGYFPPAGCGDEGPNLLLGGDIFT